MWFLAIGIAFLLLKFLGWPAMESVSWLWALSPFGLAVIWWAWADWSGYTKRRQFEKEEARKQKRIDRSKEALGTARQPGKPPR